MTSSDSSTDSSSDPQAGSFAKYILMFAAFGLFGLVIISTKYERRQTKIEQQFHGIQQMQKDAGGGGAAPGTPPRTADQQPLIITLRPLMIVVGVITAVAWLAVLFVNRNPPDSRA